MKVIDDKGRLFGKWNIIDFLVVMFILSMTPALWFGWKLYNRPKPQPQPQINWEQKYDAEIAQKEKVFKEHSRLRRYFK